MTTRRIVLLLSVITSLGVLPAPAVSQAIADSSGVSSSAVSVSSVATLPDLPYYRPTQATRFHNYLFDSFGPYPIVAAGLAAGLNQADNSPPEWGQGAAGYARRFGSDFGIAAITGTTRYALAEALGEDTLYYRCECKGVFPRLRHAMISTFIARSGTDGHRVFSLPALVAPYAGTMTAVYGWYPDRYNAKDAFRIGNYNLLAYVAGNVAIEFFHTGPHSWIHRIHLNNTHAAPEAGPSQ